jgi:hypothetical protein
MALLTWSKGTEIMTREFIRDEAAFVAMVTGAFIIRNAVAMCGLTAILAFALLSV